MVAVLRAWGAVAPEASRDLAAGEVIILKTEIPGSDLGFGHRFFQQGAGRVGGHSSVVRLDLAVATARELETGATNPDYYSFETSKQSPRQLRQRSPVLPIDLPA